MTTNAKIELIGYVKGAKKIEVVAEVPKVELPEEIMMSSFIL